MSKRVKKALRQKRDMLQLRVEVMELEQKIEALEKPTSNTLGFVLPATRFHGTALPDPDPENIWP